MLRRTVWIVSKHDLAVSATAATGSSVKARQPSSSSDMHSASLGNVSQRRTPTRQSAACCRTAATRSCTTTRPTSASKELSAARCWTIPRPRAAQATHLR
jgi:hypothetical protein